MLLPVSLFKRHIYALQDVRSDADNKLDASLRFQFGVVANPDGRTARAKERIGIGRLSFGGIERVAGVLGKNPCLQNAIAPSVDLQNFLVVARDSNRNLTSVKFGRLRIEYVCVGLAVDILQLPSAQPATTQNPLIAAQFDDVVRFGNVRRTKNEQRANRQRKMTRNSRRGRHFTSSVPQASARICAE